MIRIEKALTQDIWNKGAEILSKRLKQALGEGKRSLLMLSGGSAVSMYHGLSEFLNQSEIKPDYLAVAQVDERFNPGQSSDINAVKIDQSGLTNVLDSLGIPFYRIPQTGTLREAASVYDRLIKKLYSNSEIRIAVLGIGKDGHTAGLLRGYKDEWDKDRFVCGYENRGEYPQRITITPKALGELSYALTIVSGLDKTEAVSRIMKKDPNDINNLPGLLLHNIKEADLVTDVIVTGQ